MPASRTPPDVTRNRDHGTRSAPLVGGGELNVATKYHHKELKTPHLFGFRIYSVYHLRIRYTTEPVKSIRLRPENK